MKNEMYPVLKIDPKTDPYMLRAARWRDNLPLPTKPWMAEAFRRAISVRYHLPYYMNEPTWFWEGHMIETLVNMEGDVSLCTLDPNGPGFGVHMIGETDRGDGMLMTMGTTTIMAVCIRIPRNGNVDAYGWMRGEKEMSRLESTAERTSDIAVRMQALLTAKAVEHEDHRKPAAFRRWVRKAGNTKISETAVRVVKWRKPERDHGNAESTGSGITRGFHMVHGHFRQQWYPSEGVHRAKFISPHFRGSGPVKSSAPIVNAVRD